MRWSRVAVGVALFAAACNALTGASDLDTSLAPDGGATCATCTSANPPPPGQPPPPPSGPDASTDAGSLPSYCAGISFYARYDTTTTSAQGQLATDENAADASITFAPGKFGSAASFIGLTHALFYDSDAGPYVQASGSAAMWVKPTWTWPDGSQRVFLKPVPTRVVGASVSAGPELENRPSPAVFGLYDSEADGGGVYAASAPSTFTGVWKDLDWNHLAGTWDLAAAKLTFTLNGGSARISNVEAWAPENPVLWLRIGTAGSATIDALVDDVAVWTRVLSDAEISAIYASPIALGDACGL